MAKGRFQNCLGHRWVAFVGLTSLILIIIGCNFFSVNYWVNRLDNEKSDQSDETSPTRTSVKTGAENNSNFGSKCLTSPGDSPCPIETCVAYKGEYTAKNVITSELFGKANPSDYSCCADFQFKNNSGGDLMGFEHHVTESSDGWFFHLYPKNMPESQGNCLNYFTRKDGQESASKGVTEIVALYANPHCDWITWDEPGLKNYKVIVEGGCSSN